MQAILKIIFWAVFGRAQGLSEAVKRREYELFWLVLKQQPKLSTSVILTGTEGLPIW